MTHYLKLTAALFRYSLSRESMFKANFLLWIVVELVWFALSLMLVDVIYSYVHEVAGWSKYQMVLLIGTSHVVQQLFQFIFMINCMEFPENVRTGKFDFILLQPTDSQFLMSIRKFDIGAMVNCSVGLGIVYYAIHKLELHPTADQIGIYGSLIHYVLMLSIVSVSFWIVKAQGLVFGYYNLFQVARISREAFKGSVKVVFTFVLLMLVVANYPAQVLAGSMLGVKALWVLGLTAVFLVLSSLWFRFALRSYTSASS